MTGIAVTAICGIGSMSEFPSLSSWVAVRLFMRAYIGLCLIRIRACSETERTNARDQACMCRNSGCIDRAFSEKVASLLALDYLTTSIMRR